MRLFNGERTEDYIKEIRSKIEREIEELSEEKITADSIDEWVNYFVSEYRIELIFVYENNVELDIKEVKIKKYNIFYEQHYSFEPEFYQIDGYKIIFKIPFLGESKLFYLQPSMSIMRGFEVDELVSPKDNDFGYLYYSCEYDREYLNKQENLKTYVNEDFKNSFENYLIMVEYVNNDLRNFNLKIEKFIRDKLELKKNKYIELNNIKKALQIPIHLKEDGPNIELISLKEVKKNTKTKS